MPDIIVTLTDDEDKELKVVAAAWRRDPPAHAAVLISEALGLWQKKKPAPRTDRPRGPSEKKVSTNGMSATEM